MVAVGLDPTDAAVVDLSDADHVVVARDAARSEATDHPLAVADHAAVGRQDGVSVVAVGAAAGHAVVTDVAAAGVEEAVTVVVELPVGPGIAVLIVLVGVADLGVARIAVAVPIVAVGAATGLCRVTVAVGVRAGTAASALGCDGVLGLESETKGSDRKREDRHQRPAPATRPNYTAVHRVAPIRDQSLGATSPSGETGLGRFYSTAPLRPLVGLRWPAVRRRPRPSWDRRAPACERRGRGSECR